MSGTPDNRASLNTEIDLEHAQFEESLGLQPIEAVQDNQNNKNIPFALSSDQQEKLARLEKTIAGIHKEHGAGTIIRLDQNDVLEHAEFIPTGILPIDAILGGGFARSRVVELFGPEGSGKTSLAFAGIAAAQRAGGVGALIDVEHAFEPVRAMQLGVNLAAMYLSQPDYGEQALAIAESLAESGAVDFIVIDSVAALVPKAEYEGDMGDATVGSQARMLGQAMRKMKGKVRTGRCCVVFINQLREKIGMMFGNPEVTPGGRALKFFADVRLDIRRGDMLKEGETVFGQTCVVKAIKNKLSPPFIKAQYSLYYDQRGIDELETIIGLAIDRKIIEQKGAWFSITMHCPPILSQWAGHNLAQGQLNIRDSLLGDEKLKSALITHLTSVVMQSRKSMIDTLANQHSMGMISGIEQPEEVKKRGRGRPKKEQ